MNYKIMILTMGCVLGVLVAPIEAHARSGRLVSCIFQWADNPSLNVKGGQVDMGKTVQVNVYDELLEAGTVSARVTEKSLGTRCKFSHPESRFINRYFSADSYLFRLNRKGRVPTCDDVNMKITCLDPRNDSL